MRSARGTRIKWLDTRIESGFSNFLFIDREYRSHSVLRRIFSLARLHRYKSLLIEELHERTCATLAVENAALAVRRPDYVGSTTHRLSFWRCLPDQVSTPGDFIGYAVFKTDQFRVDLDPVDYIYEAVMPPVRNVASNNFIHCHREYSVRTIAGKQKVTGVLYAQQNDLTFVCAHVAMRSALSCMLDEGDISYARINELADVDHVSKLVGDGDGLEPADLEAVLRGVGVPFSKVVHEPLQALNLQTEFQRDLYGVIESGCPALLGFEVDSPTDPEPGRHLVPIIGHTFNDDAWVPEAQREYFGDALGYFPSEAWLSSYVLHDDNFGPYFCLPRHFLKKENFRIILGLNRQNTEFTATDAEAVGFAIFSLLAQNWTAIGQDWYDRFAVYARSNLLVLRCFLTDRKNYRAHLRAIRSWEGVSLEAKNINRLGRNLPERFWIIEASAPELFTASRRKFGEILLHSSMPMPKPVDPSIVIAVRLPGMILLPDGSELAPSTTQLAGHTDIMSLKDI